LSVICHFPGNDGHICFSRRVVIVPKPFIHTSRDQPCHPIQLLFDAVLNLIYPDNCILCAVPVSRQKDCGVCTPCWEKTCALHIRPPYCPSCGLPFQTFADTDNHLCSGCILDTPLFSGARSFGFYAAELSRLVQHMKFHGRRNLAGLLARLLTWAFFDSWMWTDFDLIVPVPLHPRRKRERGFNQATLLAGCVSKHLGIPLCESMLSRVRYTPSQVGLTDRERFRNLHQAFKCIDRSGAARQRILLIDDVMTTGATVSSASEALLSGGVARVSVLTAARVVPGVE
jgi:ComF family protein